MSNDKMSQNNVSKTINQSLTEAPVQDKEELILEVAKAQQNGFSLAKVRSPEDEPLPDVKISNIIGKSTQR